MLRVFLVTIVLVGLLCTASCSKKPTPTEIALESKTAGRAPSAADILQLDSPAEAITAATPVAAPITDNFPDDTSSNPSQASAWRHWLMLVAILLVLFFVSLILFHTLIQANL